jgi:hypothetical protein
MTDLREVENWKTVRGYDGKYSVSNYGRVYSIKRHRHLVPREDKDGYLRIVLWSHNKRKTYRVHRMVAQAWLPTDNIYNDVNHIDGNRKNNRVENLEWVTRNKNLELRRFSCNGEYNAQAEEVNIVNSGTCEIIRMCYSVEEASLFTGIDATTIRQALDTQTPVKCYRFEKGF